MSPEQQYVRRATRGLRGRVRQETQTELLDHITERTRQLTLAGLSPEQAREQAMQELGAPATVARSLRREQGFTTAAQLALGTLIGLTLLTSLTARLYAQGHSFISATVNRVLYPPQVSDPCQNRPDCVTVESGTDLTLTGTRPYGLIPLNQASDYLNGTNIQVSGLLSKHLTLPGYPDVRVHPNRIGRFEEPGTHGGYLNLPRTLVDAAQLGWPVTLNLSGTSYSLEVEGQVLPDENVVAPIAASLYLSDLLDQHLTVAVRDAARITLDLTHWTPSAWTASTLVLQRASTRAVLPTPDPARMYAAVSFLPERRISPNSVIIASLSAVAIPSVNGRLTIPINDPPASGLLHLVNSREHFLTQVRAGHAVTMLVEIPRNLRLTGDMAIVKSPERTLIVMTGRTHSRR
ncbi:permease prefix domain 1-containing protein [Deinococcus sp. 23YEL01]|uniref:permease prefix domain 1-containing protein n=1 Tax=Deinococcus sp. 23YEL01 TaxID=2745871 RepID=UPI001E607245|nr:permease prefix domain 1-containing protein [Deinococcus sp. 23YEL01]MCD0168780.1 hypothetical protein [Deinococcus sp. 23YEL01]